MYLAKIVIYLVLYEMYLTLPALGSDVVSLYSMSSSLSPTACHDVKSQIGKWLVPGAPCTAHFDKQIRFHSPHCSYHNA